MYADRYAIMYKQQRVRKVVFTFLCKYGLTAQERNRPKRSVLDLEVKASIKVIEKSNLM